MQLERVFIDTNVLISAVIFEGNERELLHFALDGRIKPIFSTKVLDEARRIFEVKFPRHLHRLQLELSLIDYVLISNPDPSYIDIAKGMVRDPGDIEILSAILAAKPDCAVTGDKDLLTDEIKAIAPVCRCADYLREHPELKTDN